jgi:hypothetical protein
MPVLGVPGIGVAPVRPNNSSTVTGSAVHSAGSGVNGYEMVSCAAVWLLTLNVKSAENTRAANIDGRGIRFPFSY